MNHTEVSSRLPKAQLAIFAEVFRVALDDNQIEGPDAGHVLKLLATERPDIPAIAIADARLRLARQDFMGAREVLEACDREHPNNATVKAMLAFCLFVLADPTWEVYANEARALPPDDAAMALIDGIDRFRNRAFEEPVSEETEQSSSASPEHPQGLAC